MKLTRLMRTTFADARSSSGTAQVEVQESAKRKSMRIMNGILTLNIVGLLLAPIAIPICLKHTAYEVSEPRVRLYGNVALVTTKLHNAGISGSEHKPYDVMERQTNVWLWKDGFWKCVLTHEAWEGAEKDQKLLSR